MQLISSLSKKRSEPTCYCNVIIHISHGFEGDIPEYQPRGDTKALARYVTLCHPMPKAEGDITCQGLSVIEGQIFWYSRPRRHVIYVM